MASRRGLSFVLSKQRMPQAPMPQPAQVATLASQSPSGGPDASTAEDLDDPLDAFMSSVQVELDHSTSAPGRVVPQRLDEEDEEQGAGFIRSLDAKAVLRPKTGAFAASSTGAHSRRDREDENDEDDDEAECAGDGEGQAGRRDETMENVLAKAQVDHERWSYPPLTRATAAPAAPPADEPEAGTLRASMGITAAVQSNAYSHPAGGQVPPIPVPARAFMRLGLDGVGAWPGLARIIAEAGWESPTPVQAQAIPALCGGWDVLGLAATGSGKTLAYALPAVVHAYVHRLQAQPQLKPGVQDSGAGSNAWGKAPSPLSLILTPTRELAAQVHDTMRKLCKAAGLTPVLVVGGAGKWAQACALHDAAVGIAHGPHVVTSTPGRLLDHIRDGAISLLRTSFLVLDEADRLLDLGFGPQIAAIADAVRPDRIAALFCATWPRRVHSLAGSVMTSVASTGRPPLRIAAGVAIAGSSADARAGLASAPPSVVQHLVACESDVKWRWVQEHLARVMIDAGKLAAGVETKGKGIIFVSSKVAADQLCASINGCIPLRAALGIHPAGRVARSLHGGQAQSERDESISAFRQGSVPLLVATDVASRGLDIPDVSLVLSYDASRTLETHTHRVGRTGRLRAARLSVAQGEAGVRPGLAVTLLTRTDGVLASSLVPSLSEEDEQEEDEGTGAVSAGTHFIAPGVRGLVRGGHGSRPSRGGYPGADSTGLGSFSSSTVHGTRGSGSGTTLVDFLHEPLGRQRPVRAETGQADKNIAGVGVGGMHGFIPQADPVSHSDWRLASMHGFIPQPVSALPDSSTSGGEAEPARKKSRWDNGTPSAGGLSLAPAPEGARPPPAMAQYPVSKPASLATNRMLYQPGIRY